MSDSGVQQGTKWNNWADTIDFVAGFYSKPASYADLVTVLGQAAQAGLPIRVVGSGHSWSLGAVPGTPAYVPGGTVNGYLLDLSGLNPESNGGDSYLKAHYFADSSGNHYVALPPGTPQGWAGKNLANRNDYLHQASNLHPPLAFGSMGPAPDITLGGFIANGCHGTGWEEPPTPDFLVAIELLTITSSGAIEPVSYAVSQDVATLLTQNKITKSTPQVSPSAMQAARASLGALGVITRMIFQAVPLFHVGVLDESTPVTTIFPANQDPTNLATLILSCDYVEIFWFPYNDNLWVKRFSRTGDAIRDPLGVIGFNWIVSELAALTHGELGVFFETFPVLTPITLKLFFASLELLMDRTLTNVDYQKDFTDKDPVVEVQDAYLYQTKYFTNIVDMELTVPIRAVQGGGYDFSDVMTAWNGAVQQIAEMRKQKQYPINLTLHARFIKGSDSLLSPANQGDTTTHTCYIEYISFSEQLPQYTTFTQAVGEQWEKLGGLPNWGKIFQLIPDAYTNATAKLTQRGSLQPFNALRGSLDPKGLFVNNFLQLLGVGAAPSPGPTAAKSPALRAPAAMTPIAVERFQVAAARSLAAGAALRRSERGCILLHDPEESVAALRDESGEGHFMTYTQDPATGAVTYGLLTKSKFLSPREIFLRVGEALK